jgi:hypothetical protein
MNKRCYNKKGYIVLLSVLLIGSAGLSIAVSIILLGLAQSRNSASIGSFLEARSLATACVEEGLQQIRDSEFFADSAELTFSNGSCNYTVIYQGGDNREIQAEGSVGNYVSRIKVTTDTIKPTINISSWQELSIF